MSDLEKVVDDIRQGISLDNGPECRVHVNTLKRWANTIERAIKSPASLRTDSGPSSLCDSISWLTKVFAFVQSMQSVFTVGSQKWNLAVESCTEVHNAISLIHAIPEASDDPMIFVTQCPKPDLQLDVSLEKARALHRVWRALNDGDCPKCHKFHAATEIHRTADGIECPSCGFYVWLSEIELIEKLFAPAMDAAVSIFEDWRRSRCL